MAFVSYVTDIMNAEAFYLSILNHIVLHDA